MKVTSDGRLYIWKEMSHGTSYPLYDSSEEWGANGGPSEAYHDFYAKVTTTGELLLVGIEYLPPGDLREEVYFTKDLQWTGGAGDCFYLGLKPKTDEYLSPIDLVAVPCGEAPGNRQLETQSSLRGNHPTL